MYVCMHVTQCAEIVPYMKSSTLRNMKLIQYATYILISLSYGFQFIRDREKETAKDRETEVKY